MVVKGFLPIFLLVSFIGVAHCYGFWSCLLGFECKNEKCVSQEEKCNGVDDCGDGSDELNCGERTTASSTSFSMRSTAVWRGISPAKNNTVEAMVSPVTGGSHMSIAVKPDSKLVVRCKTGNFGKNELNWYKPDGVLPHGSLVKDGQLIIPKIRCEDHGYYICYRTGEGYKSDHVVLELKVDQTLCLENMEPFTSTWRPFKTHSWTSTTSRTTHWKAMPKVSFTENDYMFRLACDDRVDCYKFCCNGTCVPVIGIPANTFKCDDGSLVPVSTVCNGVRDCPDGSDERSCTVECRGNEFRCGDGACIPDVQKCDGEVQCPDGTDESGCGRTLRPMAIEVPGSGMEIDCPDPDKQTKGSHVLQLECKFFGRPLPQVKWKKNEGHIPSKCISTSKFGHGILVCPNFQQSDQGAYSCVGESPLGSAESQPKTVVKCKQITCDNGFLIKDEHGIESCLRCFCSGRTTFCHSLKSQITVSSFSFPRTEVDMIVNTNGEIFMPNSSNVDADGHKTVKYCLMPEEKVQSHNFMMAYGRNLKLPAVNKRTSFMPNAPDVILTGRGVMLKYSFNRIAQNSTKMNVRFWNDNWEHSDGRHASRSDIMGVLTNLEQLFIRCEYEEGIVKIDPFAELILETAVVAADSDAVSYIEKCSCPMGYDGLSCELCAPGYKRDPITDTCKKRTIEPIECPVGTIGAECKECDVLKLYYSLNGTCVKSTCNDKGSIGLFPDEKGNCYCKARVTGKNCETCLEGNFYLDKDNQEGCKKCWCNDVTWNCRSSDFRRTTISTSIIAWDGFNQSNGGNFWLLPADFSGNLITSYGGFLRYTIKYQPNVEKQPKPLTVEILGENGVTLKYVNTEFDLLSWETEKTWSVPIEEPFWRDASDTVVTRGKLLLILTQVKKIFVESPYHLSLGKARIVSAELDVAEDASNEIIPPDESELALKVEVCDCPVGYEGTSCETCSPGYYKKRNGLEGNLCAKCECDIRYCDPLRGCAGCPKGKYNNNTNPSNTPVCLDCPCHGREEYCVKDDYDLVMCICKPGYFGTNCEIEEVTGADFQVSLFPVTVMNKKVGSLVTFNCSYGTAVEHQIKFEKRYSTSSPSRSEHFKVENYGWCSTLETNIEEDLEAVDCIVQNLGGEVVARVTAKVIGNGGGKSSPVITNCYDEPKLVIENEDVYLRCDVTGSPEPNISWHTVEKSGNFVEVNSTDGVHTISSVSLSLNGTVFVCIAQNILGDARCTTLLLVKKRCVLSIYPYNPEVVEGESIEFNCTTASGSPVEWYRLNGELPAGASNYGGRLLIPNVTMSHMGEYKCVANDPDGQSSKTTRLTVKKRRTAPTAMINSPDKEIVEGQSLTILCEVTGDPQPTVTWMKMGDNYLPENVRLSENGREMTIFDAKVKNSGLYQCRAESFRNATSRILITVLEIPEIVVQPQTVAARIGSTVEVDCSLVRGEGLINFEWLGRYLNTRGDMDDLDQIKLRIENIQPADAGDYFCVATNKAGSAEEMVRITVGDPPKVRIKPNVKTMDVVPKDVVDLECKVDGHPSPDFKWYIYHKMQGIGNSPRTTAKTVSENQEHLTVKVTDDLDSVACAAENSFGSDKSSLKFNVKSETRGELGTSKTVPIGTRVEMDFSFLGGRFNCTRDMNSMIGDECYTANGLEINNVQVQHSGKYKCKSESREMSYTIKVVGFVQKFAKSKMSYLILPVTFKSQQGFQFEITFKPEKPSGLLLLTEKHHDFIMYMYSGRLIVRLRRHSEQINDLRLSTKSLQLSVWHTAVFRLRNNGILFDSRSPMSSSPFINSSAAELTLYGEDGNVMETLDMKFDMSWKINMKDNLHLGGVSFSRRRLPLRPDDVPFEGCVSRLIVDDHEYKITEEGKRSRNVSLCNVCASEESLCGSGAECFDAPTHYGFVCVCGRDGCRKNCKGRACQTRLNLCAEVRPCGYADNKCLPNGDGLKCECASDYYGVTCNEQRAFEFSLWGNGYVKLPSIYLPRNSMAEPEVISIAFSLNPSLNSPIIPLLRQGNSVDYLSMYLENKYVVYVYRNQNKELEIKAPLDAVDENYVEVIRRNNTATLTVNGEEYSEWVQFATNRVEGDIYIGGSPESSGFHGCIHEVKIGGEKINILAKDVIRKNMIKGCRNDSTFMISEEDSTSSEDDSASENDDTYT